MLQVLPSVRLFRYVLPAPVFTQFRYFGVTIHSQSSAFSPFVVPQVTATGIEEVAKGLPGPLNSGKRPALGLHEGCRIEVLVKRDHGERDRNDGENGFGIEVWFHFAIVGVGSGAHRAAMRKRPFVRPRTDRAGQEKSAKVVVAMALVCELAGHKWDGCRCSRCGFGRDSEHLWQSYRCERYNRPQTEEQRLQAIGTAEGFALLLVVHVCRERTNMPDKSSGLSQREELIRVSAASMRSNPLSENQKALLTEMAAKQLAGDDSDIDCSDIPPLTDSQLARAIRGKFVFGCSRFPVFLNPGVLDTLTEIAARKGMVVNDLVNEVLKRELATADVL